MEKAGKYIYIITIEIYLRIPKLHITPSQALIIPQQLTILILPKRMFFINSRKNLFLEVERILIILFLPLLFILTKF